MIVIRSILFLLGMALAFPALAQEAGTYGHYQVYDHDLFPTIEYKARREAALKLLKPGEAMLVRSNDMLVRSNDVEYEFMQRKNLLYLTGVTEENSALLLVRDGLKLDGWSVQEVLFVGERDPFREAWLGIYMGPEITARVTGTQAVRSYNELQEVLITALPSITTLYYDAWRHGKDVEPLGGDTLDWPALATQKITARFPALQIRNASEHIDRLRLIKSPAEIEIMKKAIDISLEGHREAMRMAHPGVYEYELEAIMEYTFRRLGAEDPGYPSIVGSGPNTCILHYQTNRRQTRDGELVLMDCGAEYHGYSADITRTFPVSGKFTQEQRIIYDLVKEAQDSAIKACVVGNVFREPHDVAVHVITNGLIKLGIISHESDYFRYFMHGTSHFLGMDVHDVGRISEILASGMVMTVEPGIYIREGSDCDPKWWNIGVRIEDNILITERGPVNLSAELASTADEVEAVMAETE